jgi:hypothetical protein
MAAAARRPMVRSQASVVVEHPYSAPLGMQSSQTPAMPNAAKSHALTETSAAMDTTVVRAAGLIQPVCMSASASAMSGNLSLVKPF